MSTEIDALPLPCPLCGCEVDMHDDRGWEIGCLSCELYLLPSSPVCDAPALVVAAWNRRDAARAKP